MKEFLLLIRESEQNLELSPEQMQAEIEKHMAWVEELVAKGHFKDGNPLDSSGKCLKGNPVIVTDGPYVEAKECISGYYFLKAESLEAATALASGCPALASGGWLELREVMVLDE